MNVEPERPLLYMTQIRNSRRGLHKARREADYHDVSNVYVNMKHVGGQNGDKTERDDNLDGRKKAEVGNPSGAIECVEELRGGYMCEGREEDDDEVMIVEVRLNNERREMMMELSGEKYDGGNGNSGVKDEVVLEEVYVVLKNALGKRTMKTAYAEEVGEGVVEVSTDVMQVNKADEVEAR